ncbi:MAG: UvrD-helicase domain-containing protein [Clostridia bacterium]|nr:UvrD-helicase domain-containing protein [Clostridia bacterium]
MAEEKKTTYTPEQQAAIDCPGDIIVSASAGSGKTTVMIERLLKAILSGVQLENVLCVTFTKKAAANMKEKLRKKLISALGDAPDEAAKTKLKEQLAAIPAADISTIHAFCAQLIRRYFYLLDCDGSFDIVSSDDAQFKEYIDRAFENLFDRLYESEDPDFMLLLEFLRRKRKDDSVKSIILENYFAARSVSHYKEKIEASLSIYTPQGFDEICTKLQSACREKYQAIEDTLHAFHASFLKNWFGCMSGKRVALYSAIFEDMYRTLELAKHSGIFDPLPKTLSDHAKPRDNKKSTPPDVIQAGGLFGDMKKDLTAKYQAVRKDISDCDTEYERFIRSGELAKAFAHILLQFDEEFAAVKRDENKLDYNDLEHYALELLSREDVLDEIHAKYKYVFVDEYQDVNPVQEEIISAIKGQVFLVGDVKQAIYGFRGSKSKFFSEKFDAFAATGANALRIPTNFRSAPGIIRAVNDMFSASMTPAVCGFSYKNPAEAAKDAEEASRSVYDIAAEEKGTPAANAMFGMAGTSAPKYFGEDGTPMGTDPSSYRPEGSPAPDISRPILSSASTRTDYSILKASTTAARYAKLGTYAEMMAAEAAEAAASDASGSKKSKKKEPDPEGTDEKTKDAVKLAEAMLDWVSQYATQLNVAEQGHEMKACDGWEKGSSSVMLHVTGSDAKDEIEHKVYSVKEDAKEHKETRESRAIVNLVRSIYGTLRYDKDLKKEVPTQYGDICILARKNKALEGIVAALTAARIPVSGAQKGNICDTPEVRQMLDILSVIDNSEQDIALITALLSPLGKFTENDLALIRTSVKGPAASFRDCCKTYRDTQSGPLAAKLKTFYAKLNELQQAAGVISCGSLITRILSETGLEAEYSAGGGEQLRNVLRLMQEGPDLTLAGFLRKIREGGYSINSPACAPSDCVQVMTMHSSKGLEFPVVIIADISKQFTGNGAEDIYFDETYGFAPRCYNTADRTYSDTILRKYLRQSIAREDIKNELNLFYVACTRAMTRLDIMASSWEKGKYSTAKALSARSYTDLIDLNFPGSIKVDDQPKKEKDEEEARAKALREAAEAPETPAEAPAEPSAEAPATEQPAPAEPAPEAPADSSPLEVSDVPMDFSDCFEAHYDFEVSINLPIKSSASAILRTYKGADESAPDYLYEAEDEQDEAELTFKDSTSKARGTAYHRFLELCNFSVRTPERIQDEILNFVTQDDMTAEEAAFLNPAELSTILSEPVFRETEGAQTLREQEFLCRIPACKIMDTTAQDTVLVQGALDLLICKDGRYHIVDYKYSHKDPELLKKTYIRQLRLYRAAVSRICGVPEDEIPATIVNIHRMYTVEIAPGE